MAGRDNGGRRVTYMAVGTRQEGRTRLTEGGRRGDGFPLILGLKARGGGKAGRRPLQRELLKRKMRGNVENLLEEERPAAATAIEGGFVRNVNRRRLRTCSMRRLVSG